MDWFAYRDGRLYAEDVDLVDLASRVGTPAFVYSRKTLEHHYDALAEAFARLRPLICYSVKSCGNVHLLRLLAERGAGMDVVSGGELYRTQAAGVDPTRVVYAGVAKTREEIREALAAGIAWFNIESEEELENVAAIAGERGTVANAALRVNPDVDPRTHAKTTTGKKETKFGVDIERARHLFDRHGDRTTLRLRGIHLHIGSPIYTVEPYVDAIGKAVDLIGDLRAAGHRIDTLDIGGGFGADYRTQQTPPFEEYAEQIVSPLEPFVREGGRVLLEPGRSIAANAGVLLTRVQYMKRAGAKRFAMVDTGMHQLLRPALYDAFHFIWPAAVDPSQMPPSRRATVDVEGLERVDVAGPICESSDVVGADRDLPPLRGGDLLGVFGAGAYGMAMASQYNALPRPPEVLIDGDHAEVIRRRETYEDLVAPERERHPA